MYCHVVQHGLCSQFLKKSCTVSFSVFSCINDLLILLFISFAFIC